MYSQNSIRKNFLFLILFILISLPSFLMVQLSLSSLATGALVSYLVILSLLGLFSLIRIRFYPKKIIYFFLISIFVIFHGIIISFFSKNFDFYRFFGTYVLFFLMFHLVLIIRNLFETNYFNNIIADKAFILIFKVFLFLGISSFVFNIVPFVKYSQLNRGVFPFFEPSHYVLSISPFLLYFLTSQVRNREKYFYYFIFSSFLLFVNNLTLLITCIIVLSLSLKKRSHYLLGIIFIIPILVLIVMLNLEYYSSRLIQNDSENLSTLVWIQGWENSILMLKQTWGLGVGFQQFGIGGLKGAATDAIAIIRANDDNSTLNQLDGGTLGAKIIGEFGIFGVLAIIWLLKNCIISFIRLKSRKLANLEPIEIFYLCILVSFFVELFVRSMSYISNSMFFLILALTITDKNKLKNNVKKSQH